MNTLQIIDDKLLYMGDRFLGHVQAHKPMKETIRHAKELAIPFGEIRRLTGHVYVANVGALKFFENIG